MRRSQRSPVHSLATATRWPAERSIACQRPAVWRLPVRLPGGAGVTMRMRAMGVGYTLAAMVADLRDDLLDARKRSARVTADLEGERPRRLVPGILVPAPQALGRGGAVDAGGRGQALRFGEGRARHALGPAAAGPEED